MRCISPRYIPTNLALINRQRKQSACSWSVRQRRGAFSIPDSGSGTSEYACAKTADGERPSMLRPIALANPQVAHQWQPDGAETSPRLPTFTGGTSVQAAGKVYAFAHRQF